jgi:hypothetical protein
VDPILQLTILNKLYEVLVSYIGPVTEASLKVISLDVLLLELQLTELLPGSFRRGARGARGDVGCRAAADVGTFAAG